MLAAADLARTVIIGNTGAGKSHLAARLARDWAVPCYGLDDIHWELGGYTRPRMPVVAARLLHDVTGRESWIIEGVFGGLAAQAMLRATLLLWLDLPIDACIRNLRIRGEASNALLIEWAEGYSTRDSPTSHQGHLRLFQEFRGASLRLTSRQACDEWPAPGLIRPVPAPP
jgi:adenylate kinase family enzyme